VPVRRSRWAVLAAAMVACSSPDPSRSAAPATTPPPATAGTSSTPPTSVPATSTPATTVAAATFTSTVSPVTTADVPASWRPGCPVGVEGLREVRLSYWGFDDRAHSGTIVVAASVTAAVTSVFRQLFDQRFPIRRMEPVDAFGGDDDASMAADNTSGFNCRNAVSSGPPHWSAHAYGQAIDVNPVENPYLLDGGVLPPSGAAYVDRSSYRPGMAVRGGQLPAAFASVGWSWGGLWASPDYQHFSATGG
jgi:hypothetical protein